MWMGNVEVGTTWKSDRVVEVRWNVSTRNVEKSDIRSRENVERRTT